MLNARFEEMRTILHWQASLLDVCDAEILELEEMIRNQIVKVGHLLDVFLSSSMIDMYDKCGKLNDDWSIYSETKVWKWYHLHGHERDAILRFWIGC